ncbi:MAG: HEAT repeat domain-containing protein [Verrucomicrobia bacterium]|nr:HEAT repeat domain-containing protein [Verrucomicrobiota bacterium]
MNFLFGKSRLKRAIERGLANGRLREELMELGDLTLKSRADAEAVCWGLLQLAGGTASLGQSAYALAGLFQDVEDGECDAFEVLRERGIPELLRLFDLIQESPEEDDTNTLLFILKMLALYGTTGGTLKIIEAARRPLKPDGYMWSVVLGNFKSGHPEAELLFRSLRDPLPPDFIGVSLLDAANACLIEGGEMSHPFDSHEGKQRLRAWLTNPDPGEYSCAHSATAALPFISNPDRDQLLDLAMKHPDAGVQLEAAWAAAKLGREDGLGRLADHCRDFKHAQRAKRYLGELGREDVIPAAANDPGFEALAEFAQWLAHPNELGRAPDELEIVDRRNLAWPPEREPKPFWLVKYRAKDTTGLDEDDVECGLVGSTTFCFFSYKLAERPPEDAYAVHCYWEMEQAGLIEESDVKKDPAEYQGLLKQWQGAALENPQMRFVAELSPRLRYPQRLVGLAATRLEDCDGWVVLDGDRSEWYPKPDMPPDAFESVVLKIHVGRHLLGLVGKPDRRKYLAAPPTPKPTEEIIAAYLKLLSEAQKQEGKARKEAFDSFGPLGKHLEEYANALVRVGREKEIVAVIRLLAPFWDHNAGYGTIGKAAFKCSEHALAEGFFLRLRDNYEDSHRSEEMGLLAEIWCKGEKQEDAKGLLLDCLRRLVAESKTATGSDRRYFEDCFQKQRATLLRLFPSDGQAVLAENGLPSSTLN